MAAFLALAIGATAASSCGPASGTTSASEGWNRFRGPNGSGVSATRGLPVRFGPELNVAWKTALPPGHSSPVLAGGRIFLTAVEEDELVTYGLDRDTGEIAWRAVAPRPRTERLDRRNSPAAPTPASDGDDVFVFFGDYGLLAYGIDGRERWRLPLGPFDNAYGMGSSPIVVDDTVVLVCDQATGSFMLAVDKRDGSIKWRVERPESHTGHSTPIVWRPPGEAAQLLVPGSFFLTGYALATGERIWWVSGLAFEMKATPVLGDGGRTVYIHGTSASSFTDSYGRAIPPFEQVRDRDVDGDGRFTREEVPDELAARWMRLIDLDADGALDRDEWDYYRAARASTGGLYAFRTGGRRDMTEASLLWHHDRAVPQLPSPLLYDGVLYIVDDGGIVSLFDPASGELLARGRIPDAIDNYFASPVAGNGKVYLASENGKVVVLRAGREIDILAVNEFDDLIYATPALADGRVYLRTGGALYAFDASRGSGAVARGRAAPAPPGP